MKKKKMLIKESRKMDQQLDWAYAEELQRRDKWDQKYWRRREAERRRISELSAEIKAIELRQKEEGEIWSEVLHKIQSNRDKTRKKASHQ